MKAQFETGAHVKVISYPDKAIVGKECVITGTVHSMSAGLPFYKVRQVNGKKEYTVGESRLVPWKEEQPGKKRVEITVLLDIVNDAEKIKAELAPGKKYGSIPGIVAVKTGLDNDGECLRIDIKAEVEATTTDLELGLLIRAMYNAMSNRGPIMLGATVNDVYLMDYEYFGDKGFNGEYDRSHGIKYMPFMELPDGKEICIFELDSIVACKAPSRLYKKLVSNAISGITLQYPDIIEKYYGYKE